MREDDHVAYEFEPWIYKYYGDKINVAYGPSSLSNIIQKYGCWCN